jgi:flavin reductase (DIM6/NTAB) family NADH-FMN oxidoreductase RutF
MIVDPGSVDPAIVYRMMTGIVVPRPIAFVSSLSPDGIRNLAPFSFFTAVCGNPPMVCFCPMIRTSDGRTKDTLRNIEATREFVVNIVSEDFAAKMNICSAEFPPEVDEFVESGLTPRPSDLVRPPRVGEARVAMECRLWRAIHVSDRRLGGSVVLGEVVRFHLDDRIVNEYRVDPDGLRAIARMGGPTYLRTTDRFDMERPPNPVRR